MKPLGHLLKVSVTCTVGLQTNVAAISRFLCLWFTMSCTMSMVAIAFATHFLAIFTVCKFGFVI